MQFSFFLLVGFLFSIDVKPLSYHKKVSRREKGIYQIHENGQVNWYQAGPKPDWSGTPHSSYDDRWKDPKSTILIQIAALAESRLGDTLYHFLTKAKFPERVLFVVIQQNGPNDKDALILMCQRFGHEPEWSDEVGRKLYPEAEGRHQVPPKDCPYQDQVIVKRMTARQAKGPVYARGLANEYVDDSKHDFCLQIDAHETAIENWDVEILKEWSKIDNEFAVISTYPTAPDHLQDTDGLGPHLCNVDLWDQGIRNTQARTIANWDRPILAPLWAAGLSFSRCHADSRVPTDPNLLHIFLGEEFARGARLWTNGYDFYSLNRPIIGAWYGNEKKNHLEHWKKDPKEQKRGMSRMRTLLKFPRSDQSDTAVNALGKYGMGTKRTFDDYMRFCGINTTALTQTKGDDNCIVYYVPWDDRGVKEEIDLAENPMKYSSKKKDDDIKLIKVGDINAIKMRDQATGLIWWQFILLVGVCVIIFALALKLILQFLDFVGERKDK